MNVLCTVKRELRMAMVFMMLSTACNVLGPHENLVKHHFSLFFTVFPVSPVFHGLSGELVRAVAVSLRACTWLPMGLY